MKCEVTMKDVHPMEVLFFYLFIYLMKIHQVYSGLFVGELKTTYVTKILLRNGIAHVLNEYTKRTKYFKYLTIDIYDSNQETFQNNKSLCFGYFRKVKSTCLCFGLSDKYPQNPAEGRNRNADELDGQ